MLLFDYLFFKRALNFCSPRALKALKRFIYIFEVEILLQLLQLSATNTQPNLKFLYCYRQLPKPASRLVSV